MNTKQQNLESLKDIHHRFSETISLNRLTGEDERGGMNESGARVTSLVTDSRRVTPGSAFFEKNLLMKQSSGVLKYW